MNTIIFIALGNFIGNWVIVPLIFKKINFKKGFWIGIISAIILIVFGVVAECLGLEL